MLRKVRKVRTMHTSHMLRTMHTRNMLHTSHMCNDVRICDFTLILHTRNNVLANVRAWGTMCAWDTDRTGERMTGRGNAGAYAARDVSQRTTLGDAGTLGTGRTAVGYAYCRNQAHVHIAPARAYTREPMAGTRERAIVRFTVRTSVGTSPVRERHYDAWDGTRRILPSAWYVGSEQHKRDQRERVRNAPDTQAHTCPRERRDVTRRCDCDALRYLGTARHDHDDAYDDVPTGGPCTRTHANVGQQRACDLVRAHARALRINAYVDTVRRIDAR